ncbi:MAG: hypothetical protein [Bacteriophage sp.]|nr:MAG: hypothetical protein [Bacteriophage sp.]
MNCGNNCGCSITYEELLQYLDSYIANALLCGKLQGGLNACESTTILPQGTGVVTCSQLKDLINGLIKDGEINIPGIEELKLDGTHLKLTDQAGKTWDVDLDGLLDRTVKDFKLTSEGQILLTLKDGTTFKIPLQEYLADLVKDASIKSGILDQDGDLVLSLGNGDTVKVNMDALKKVYVERDGPIIGDGTEENPLDIDFSRVCWQVIESMHFTDEGLVIQIANQCDPVVLPLSEILAVLNNKVQVCVDTEQGVITGNGAEGKCLSIDLSRLISLVANDTDLIGHLVDAINNYYTSHEDAAKGLGQALACKVPICTSEGVIGSGTETDPARIDPDWLTDFFYDLINTDPCWTHVTSTTALEGEKVRVPATGYYVIEIGDGLAIAWWVIGNTYTATKGTPSKLEINGKIYTGENNGDITVRYMGDLTAKTVLHEWSEQPSWQDRVAPATSGLDNFVSPFADAKHVPGNTAMYVVNTFSAPAGNYLISTYGDDVARIYIDGARVTEAAGFGGWKLDVPHTLTANGEHQIIVYNKNIPDNTPGWCSASVKDGDGNIIYRLTANNGYGLSTVLECK